MIFNIAKISCWSPDLKTYQDWSSWAQSAAMLPNTFQKPVCNFIPATIRRRASSLTRAALCTIAACSPEPLPIVFVSRHGESETTFKLLTELKKQEDLSPNSFTMSVQNTCCGIYSISTASNNPGIAVSVRTNQIPALFFEVAAQLNRYPAVIGVVVDAPIAEIFKPYVKENNPYFSLAFLFTKEAISGFSLSFEYYESSGTEEACTSDTEKFLRFIFSKQVEFLLSDYKVQRLNGNLIDCFVTALE